MQGLQKDFTVTSGTLFASHKLPLKAYLAAIAVFCNEVKGKSALALSRDLGLSYKAAFVLLHKFREAMSDEMKGRVVGGEGKSVEVDGGYFGGYVKPANFREKFLNQFLRLDGPKMAQDPKQTVFAQHLPVRITGFDQRVGKAEQAIAGFQLHVELFVLRHVQDS